MNYSLPGSSVHGIFQAKILEWVTISFSRGSSQLRGWTSISCFGRWILYHWATREALSKWLAISFDCYPLYFNKYACTDVSLNLDRIHLLALAGYHNTYFATPTKLPLTSPNCGWNNDLVNIIPHWAKQKHVLFIVQLFPPGINNCLVF